LPPTEAFANCRTIFRSHRRLQSDWKMPSSRLSIDGLT
jgi:hypothetical protein